MTAEGDIYVVDWKNHRLNMYDAEGEYICGICG